MPLSKPERGKHLTDFGGFLLDGKPAADPLIDAQHHVVSDRQGVQHQCFLENCADLESLRLPRRFQGYWGTLPKQFPGIGRYYPAQNLYKGAFTRTILPNQSVD